MEKGSVNAGNVILKSRRSEKRLQTSFFFQQDGERMENAVTKKYVDLHGVVVFLCPKCGAVKRENAQVYQEARGPIKIECSCGHTYEVKIEFRKHYRKETKLDGAYITPDAPDRWERLIVKNLSMEGCGFESIRPNLLDPDQEIIIEFELDDAKQSLIRKTAVVCSVYKKYVGCKFKQLPGYIDTDLGFYLRNL